MIQLVATGTIEMLRPLETTSSEGDLIALFQIQSGAGGSDTDPCLNLITTLEFLNTRLGLQGLSAVIEVECNAATTLWGVSDGVIEPILAFVLKDVSIVR